MKRKNIGIFLFVLIVLLAFALRFFNLGNVPPGVNRDEAAIGYNAYSLLMTGKDEYGRVLPVSFESFGDWKLPVYIYTTLIPVKLFGLSPFAVRLPSALAGVIAVALSFFLIKELFGKSSLAFLTMLLFAIAPWSLHLSRIAYEANLSVCIFLAGVLFFLKGLKKKNWWVIAGALLLGLSFGTYASNYLFTPLLALGLLLIYRKEVFQNRFGWVSILVFVLVGGFLWYQTTSANTVKLSGTSIFGDPSVVNAKIETPRNEHDQPQSITAKLFHNRVSFGIERFAQNYLNAFSPEFLFIKGGTNHAHNIANFGNMYLVEAFFFFLGFVYLLTQKRSKGVYLALWWILIAPLAASLTKDAPHTVRMFAIFPMPVLLVAGGLLWFVTLFRQKMIRAGVIVMLVFLFVINISVYFDRYYVHFPRNEAQNWGIAYDRLSEALSSKELQDKKVIMTGVTESPYIYLLFYGKYDPRQYQKEAIRYPITSEGFEHVKRFGRLTFRDIDWGKDLSNVNTLLVDKTQRIPADVRARYKTIDIPLPSGDSWFSIVILQDTLAQK